MFVTIETSEKKIYIDLESISFAEIKEKSIYIWFSKSGYLLFLLEGSENDTKYLCEENIVSEQEFNRLKLFLV